MVIALAGRRVDADNAVPRRFPNSQVEAVKQRIAEFLRSHQVSALVSDAACGASILALEAAGDLGLRRRVVLPFNRVAFRASAVVDRGGDWGERYDSIIGAVDAQGDLVEFAHDINNEQTYFIGNEDILDQAQQLAQELGTEVASLIVWNRESRGQDDVTGHFRQESEVRGFRVDEVITL